MKKIAFFLFAATAFIYAKNIADYFNKECLSTIYGGAKDVKQALEDGVGVVMIGNPVDNSDIADNSRSLAELYRHLARKKDKVSGISTLEDLESKFPDLLPVVQKVEESMSGGSDGQNPSNNAPDISDIQQYLFAYIPFDDGSEVGVVGNAMYYDGSIERNGYKNFSDFYTPVYNNGGYTIAFWAKFLPIEPTSKKNPILTWGPYCPDGESNYKGAALFVRNGLRSDGVTHYLYVGIKESDGNYYRLEDVTDINVYGNEWHHYAISFNWKTRLLKIFIDGQKSRERYVAANPPHLTRSDIFVGAVESFCGFNHRIVDPSDGLYIDEMYIFSKDLNDERIRQLYEDTIF